MKRSPTLVSVRKGRISALLETSLSPSSGIDMMIQLNTRGGFTAFIRPESVKSYKKYVVIHKIHKCLVNTRRNIQYKKILIKCKNSKPCPVMFYFLATILLLSVRLTAH
jgi:hypothetical protein